VLLDREFERADPAGLNGIAWFLETSPHVEATDGANELRFAEKAASQSGRKECYILDTLALAYARAGEFDKAIAVENEAIMKAPDENLKTQFKATLKLLENGFSLSRVCDLNRGGKADEARALVDRAIGQAAPSTLNDLAWRLAISPDAQMDDSQIAMRFADKAVALTARTNASYIDTLAAAYAAAGDFAKAVTVQQEAVALLKNANMKSDFESRLRLYESNFPYRAQPWALPP
jgi:tetratricopeptide (TPR) repeat protein